MYRNYDHNEGIVTAFPLSGVSYSGVVGNFTWQVHYNATANEDIGEPPSNIAIAGPRLFLGVRGGVLALNISDGSFLWKSQPFAYPLLWDASDPLVDKEMLILRYRSSFRNSGGGLLAFDCATGQVLWDFELPSHAYPFDFASDGRDVVLFSSMGGFQALSRSTGAVLWSSNVSTSSPFSVDDEGRVFVQTTRDSYPFFEAWNASDGSVLWSIMLSTSGNVAVSSELHQVVVLGTTAVGFDYTGAFSWDTRDGSFLWNISKPTDWNTARPVIGGNSTVFFSTSYNGVCAFHLSTGDLIWCYGYATPRYPFPASLGSARIPALIFAEFTSNNRNFITALVDPAAIPSPTQSSTPSPTPTWSPSPATKHNALEVTGIAIGSIIAAGAVIGSAAVLWVYRARVYSLCQSGIKDVELRSLLPR